MRLDSPVHDDARRSARALLAAALVTVVSRAASAEPPSVAPPRLDLSNGVAKTPASSQGTYVHGFGEFMLGKGLRLNNPFRLATPVGDDPDGLSFTAYYLDLGVGAVFGPPAGLQHGGEASLSIATDGIAQQVMSLSYVALHPLGSQALVRGRAGLPIIIGPDANVGMEIAGGAAWLFTGGLGLTAEVVGSLFYGAATPEKSSTAFPVLSLEIGIWIDHEVLP
jgi:hypothetical protein